MPTYSSTPKLLDEDSPDEVDAIVAGGLLADRFQLQKLLGKRQGAHTYLAVDLKTGDQVVAKLIAESALPQGALIRMEYEVSLLAGVQSDWFAGVRYAGRDNHRFWLVSNFVAGCSLRQRHDSWRLRLAARRRQTLDATDRSGICNLAQP